MIRALLELKSITPVTFNKKLKSEKGPNETHDDLEKRVWRERCETNGNGLLVLGGNRFKKCFAKGAKNLNMQIPGEGKATYTKHFLGGLIVVNSIELKINADEVDHELIYTSPRPRDGKRWIHFPTVKEWSGELQITITDEKITEAVFRKVVDYAGMNVGIGSWRPENGGENGRFECVEMVIEKV